MLARAGGTYVHRISLTYVAGRRPSWFVCLAFFLVSVVGVAAAKPALAADPKIEKEVQALQKKAIEEDNLNVNYAGAVKKLQTAVTKCDGDKCNSSLKAAVLRDLGAMQVLNGQVDEGKASFASALGMDSSIDLDPAYKNPQLEGIWNDVKKKGGGGGGAPVKAGPQPTGGDFVHSPPTEALLRTPLPVYVEYSGSEELSRVTVKYKGFGQSEWKTLELKKSDSGYGALIPCKDVTQGLMQYYVQGFTDGHDPVANSGSKAKPFTVPVNTQISGPAPSLPGEEPPEQCADTDACPPDFPGCGGKKKGGGSDCSKDADCDSGSCVDDKCAEKKQNGDECEKDNECSSDTCSNGKCSGGKKGEGETCDADEDCDSDKCTEGKCAAGAGGKKPAKLWIGLNVAADIYFLPGANDVCLLNPMSGAVLNSAGYTCVDPNTGGSFPPTQTIDREITLGSADQVVGGLKLGNIRIMLSADYALSQNILLGLRAGYVLLTDPVNAPFPPLHVEGRFTYLLGKNATTKKGLSPMLFVGAGAGEFDASVPVTVNGKCSGPPNGCSPAGKALQENVNAWLTAGPVFFTVGGGFRALVSPRAAVTGALKFEGALGGAAGFLPGVAPELGVQFGF
jgi:hypothetical protein